MFGACGTKTANNECYFISDVPHSKLNYGPQAEDMPVSLFVDAVRSNKIFHRVTLFLKKSDFLLNRNMEQVRSRNATAEN
jgi:hypothetical protein